METNEMTKTQRNAMLFAAKNTRRKNGRDNGTREERISARAERRARIHGAFGEMEDEDFNRLAFGTTGTRGGE